MRRYVINQGKLQADNRIVTVRVRPDGSASIQIEGGMLPFVDLSSDQRLRLIEWLQSVPQK